MLASEIERMGGLLKSRESKMEELRRQNQELENQLKELQDLRNDINVLHVELGGKNNEIDSWAKRYEELANVHNIFDPSHRSKCSTIRQTVRCTTWRTRWRCSAPRSNAWEHSLTRRMASWKTANNVRPTSKWSSSSTSWSRRRISAWRRSRISSVVRLISGDPRTWKRKISYHKLRLKWSNCRARSNSSRMRRTVWDRRWAHWRRSWMPCARST